MLNNEIQIDYLADRFKGFDIELLVDPIRRKRTDDDDNVIGIFYEEQPLMWKLFKDEIAHTIRAAKGTVDFLDVGTGSGFWAITVAKNIGGRVIAIDKSQRAINIAVENISLNHVCVELRKEIYSRISAPYRQVKAISLTAPYHIYPRAAEENIPQHARGGPNGFEEFKNQIAIANHHLAPEGKIFFNQMCLGDIAPEFVNFIPDLIEGNPSIHYINLLPPIKTHEFLLGVYDNSEIKFIESISAKYPNIFYTDGVIYRDGAGQISSEVLDQRILEGRRWHDRISLHKEIAAHDKHEEVSSES